jgi:hypothetical protein
MSRTIGWAAVGVLAAAVLVAVPNGLQGGAGGARPEAAADNGAQATAAAAHEVLATAAPGAAPVAQKARRPESAVPRRRPTSTARPLMDSVRPPVPWPCRPLGAIAALKAVGAVPRVVLVVPCLHRRGFA